MWKEEEMPNEYLRQMARDMPHMPKLMRTLFYIGDWMQSRRLYFLYGGIALTFVISLYLAVSSLALMGGYPREGMAVGAGFNEVLKIGIVGVITVFFVNYVAPNIVAVIARIWYYSTRHKFQPPASERGDRVDRT